MIIRPAIPEELPRLCAIVSQAIKHLEEQGIRQWDEIYPDEKILARDLQKGSVQVIEQSGEVCGFIVLNETQSPEYATVEWKLLGRALVVHRLTITPLYQRCGLASLLMTFAEETAAAEGYECIRLDAFTLNPAALNLYDNRGYRRTGVVRFRKGDFYCYEKAIVRIGD
jgi:ribosomal protein S18 acetylase RimI-like enzyme